MNRVFLMGNLGKDAELKVLAGDNAVCNFSVATSETWKDKQTGEKKERTEWHRCQLFGPRAKSIAQYLVKGTKVVVEGSIRYGSYEKDGVKHYTTDINVTNVEFAGGGKKSDDGGGGDSGSSDNSDIPF